MTPPLISHLLGAFLPYLLVYSTNVPARFLLPFPSFTSPQVLEVTFLSRFLKDFFFLLFIFFPLGIACLTPLVLSKVSILVLFLFPRRLRVQLSKKDD